MVALTVRPMQFSDVPRIVDYWCNATPEDLERMGADPAKVPPRETLRRQLEELAKTPESATKAFYSIWLMDGRPIGYSPLKNIVHGHGGEMHLHVWEGALRGKGYGATLFCKSAVDFFDRFALKAIVCEPSSKNPMPNGMLTRVGFAFRGTRLGASSELSLVGELNTYEIAREVAEAYLSRTRDIAP
jgi:RimJ/RimL family protein N-acetyltransferase